MKAYVEFFNGFLIFQSSNRVSNRRTVGPRVDTIEMDAQIMVDDAREDFTRVQKTGRCVEVCLGSCPESGTFPHKQNTNAIK